MKMITKVCEAQLLLKEKIKLNISPCSFWKGSHNGQPCTALVYNGKIDNKLKFIEFVNDMLNEKRNVLKACCVHLDDKLSDHPILMFGSNQSLKDYVQLCKTIAEVDQLTVLRDIARAVGNLGFLSSAKLIVTMESIFVQEDSNGKIYALFSPFYQHSYFPQAEQSLESQTDCKWIKNALLMMHYRNQYSEHSELPESHILYNIFKYKWFSKEETLHPNNIIEVAKEITYILGELINSHFELFLDCILLIILQNWRRLEWD